jgi:alkanesulfonate monooxygenase SsuD/methylene tetrahydromethanopterin reductase-like flavin-dependent oxidoreductase (luciferase family)
MDVSSVPETGIVIPEHAELSLREQADFAVDAVDAGFESVWCSDEWGYDPVAVGAAIAGRTDVPLGFSVANVYARSPATLARGALALDDATDGRFVLGIGSSTVGAAGLHGDRVRAPLKRLRETREIVDLALSGEAIEYDGEYFDLSGFRLRGTDPDRSVPVFNAANGPDNLALSVEHMDGVLPHLLPRTGSEPALAEAHERTGVGASTTSLPVVPTSVSDDPAAAESVLSMYVARLVGTTNVFATLLSRHGFADSVEAARTCWAGGDRGGAADAIDRELLEDVGVVGTPDRAAAQFECWLATPAVDGLIVATPYGVTDEMLRGTLRSLP